MNFPDALKSKYDFAVLLAMTTAVFISVEPAWSVDNSEPDSDKNAMSVDQELPLIFSDDFENGREHWTTTDDAAWILRQTESSRILSLKQRTSDYEPAYRSPHNIALIKNISVSDFVFSFDVRNTKDTGNHRDCCIFFCYQNPNRFYYAHLGAKPDLNSGQVMIVNEAPRRPLTANRKQIDWDEKWHKVKATFDSASGEFKVYFDDMNTAHMSMTDKTLHGGRIGIGSFDDMNDFDNVRLYGVKVDAGEPEPKQENDKWTELFNGKDLKGWTRKNGTATYKVVEGTIKGTTSDGSPNSFLCTDKEYADFELVFDVRLRDPQLNSGVQIRSKSRDDDRVFGPQVEIEASGKEGAEAGYVYGEATGRGWLTTKDRLKPHKIFLDDKWNSYRIIARGPRIQTWINGKPVEDLTDEPIHKTHPTGFIGLQVHSIPKGSGPWEVQWRKIKIRKIE